jgi:hypothetical protein
MADYAPHKYSNYHEKILISTQVATELRSPPISNEEEFYRAGYNTTQESLSKNLKRAHPNESESTQKGLYPPIGKRSRPNKTSTTPDRSANIADMISAPLSYYEISPDVDDPDLERESQPEAARILSPSLTMHHNCTPLFSMKYMIIVFL